MKILYATSEAVPFCKTGGLADVAGSLPTALGEAGADIAVVLPLYTRVKEKFGDEAEPLYERLAKFFQILESYNFIMFREQS